MSQKRRYTIYARYSTDRQNPSSCQDQIDSIQREVSRKFPDWEPVEPFYQDGAQSGTSTTGRAAFLRMLEDAKGGKFDVVLVEDVARFARDRYDAMRYRLELSDYDVQILSQSESWVDPDSESGLWITAIKETKAHADVLEIGRRVRRGLAAQASKGYIVNHAPYGYRRKPIFDESRVDADGRPYRIGVKLEPDPEKAAIVRRIFRLYGEGLGFARVAFTLNEEKIPSARGGTWDQTAIRAMILNETYLGHIVARKVQKKRRANGTRRIRKVPEADQIRHEHAHEPIVSQELWDEVHAIFAARSATCRATGLGSIRRRPYLLSGMVQCGECGGTFIHETSGPPQGRVHYCRCGIRRRRGTAVCGNEVSVRKERLEFLVSGLIRDDVLRPDLVVDVAAHLMELTRSESPGSRAERLREERAGIERRISNLVGAIADGAGKVPSIVEKLAELERQKSALDRQIANSGRRSTRKGGFSLRTVEERIERALRKLTDEGPIEERRTIVASCFDSIEVKSDGILLAKPNPAKALELVGIPMCANGAGSGT